ncbi:AAA family ATPase [Desulfurispirillum indicum S5]|uniref:AAA family ATPase n=1 Tax=Desulfurispirillum indicum (strain ATCC BAA-1389 / DSM 22839 / S5) TaxID=653733 RepID=E6W0T3_DESIS|nr:ATP-binding protein [Desulfurispirillum indicum]ADU66428.1 AAA family ATPase [Desulfurispirillum indicum S5]
MNDTDCQNEQGAPGHVMIECLKQIIREYEELEPPGELLPRRIAIGSLPGKVSVVTSVRGSGKTILLRQRIRQLIEGGVPRENILSLDLADDRLYWLRHENPDLILEAYFELHPQKRGSETVHCFFDEVQALPHWQLFIERLMRTEKCEVTVAGSLLPAPEEETASPLTGRIVSWEIFPLSFREFLDGKDIDSDGPLSTKQRLTIQKAFEDYWQVGGFPGVNRRDQQQRVEAHQANWKTILASIIGHHNISHPRAVIDLAHWLVDNTGFFYAISHLTDYLKSLGHRVRKSSVVDWLVAFEDAGLLFSVNIFSNSPTRISVNPRKVYCIDHALAASVSSGILTNRNSLLENLVFTALRRVTPEIFYHRTKTGREVDLVALLPSVPGQEQAIMLVQVCASLADPRVRQSEVRSLSEAMVELAVAEGTIVTWRTDETIPVGFGTIQVVPVWRFLLETEPRI